MELREMPVKLTGETKRKVKEIYTGAFSAEDRMPYWLMFAMDRLTKSTELLAFYDGETLCGFAYNASLQGLTFIMFFATDASLRSKGYGSAILEKIRKLHPQDKVIVTIERCDVEAPNLEQRHRRKSFYLKNGYSETGYLIKLGKQTQEILVLGGVFDPDEFVRFFQRYSNGTMTPTITKMQA